MDLGALSIKIARNENLPVLPDLVNRILAMTENAHTSFSSLEQLVEREPAVSAKILRAANSAFYGNQQVSSLTRAMSILGMSTVRSLSVSLAMHQMIGVRSPCPSFDKLAFWRHCLGAATAARIIGRLKLPSHAEELYGWGLMHDIGLLVMERHLPEQLDKVFRSAKAEGMTLDQAEFKLLGFVHSEVGALLAEKWCLPENMRCAIAHHLEPTQDQKHFQSTVVVHIADAIARSAGLSEHGRQEEIAIDPMLLSALDMPEDQLPAIGDVVLAEVERSESVLLARAA